MLRCHGGCGEQLEMKKLSVGIGPFIPESITVNLQLD